MRSNLDDPRKIPYLLVWKDERDRHGSAYRLYDGEIKEAVRLTCYADRCPGYVELKRTDGTITILRIVWRALPRNGGGALFLLCPYCNIPRRFVYGWEWDWASRLSNRVRQVSWRCRTCAQLRYSSEGGALRPLARGQFGAWLRALGDPPLPHPVPWLPFVFASPEEAAPHELVSETYPLTHPSWSPNGSKLTYTAMSEAGDAAGIYVLDRSTGAKERIPGSAGLLSARWSPDGKYLASVSENYRRVALFNWSTRKWRELVKGTAFGPLGWSSDSQFLYYQDVLEKDEPVHRIRIKDGKTERIVECQPLLEGGVQHCGFDGLLADGSPLLRLTRGDHDVYSLEVELP